MRHLTIGLIVIIAFSLVACKKTCMETYANNDLNSERARVSFLDYGDSYQDRHNTMLRKSAETTLSRGYNYFIIINSSTSPVYGSYDNAYQYMDRRPQPVLYTNGPNRETRKFESTVLIKMFNCPQVTNVYNARELLSH